jgi:two-component system nitrate/nitrite response regulator NarL
VKIAIVSPVRLFRECLMASLNSLEPEHDLRPEACISALINYADNDRPEVSLVDVTQGLELEEVAAVAAKWPELCLIAIGLLERRDEVVRHGRAGFVAYISREATVEDLRRAMREAMNGRLHCPAEISNGLIRALFRRKPPPLSPAPDPSLTGREAEVLHMIGRGLSNKEIARDLDLSVATVKQHVHHVLAKLGVGQRAHAMRRVREQPWIGR